MTNIGLVQINNSFSGQNYLPYSIACLQSYAQCQIAAGPFHLPADDLQAHPGLRDRGAPEHG